MDNHKPTDDKLVNVATIHNNDEAADRIHTVLKAVNIPVLIDGSLVLGVSVYEQDRDRALTILEENVKKYHYWILLDKQHHL